jgi:hypothetical protein
MRIWLVFITEKIDMLTVEKQTILKSKEIKLEECKKLGNRTFHLIILQFFGVGTRNPFLRLVLII